MLALFSISISLIKCNFLWWFCSSRQLQISTFTKFRDVSVWPTQAWNIIQKLLEAINFDFPAYFSSAASPFHLEAAPVSFLMDEVNWYEWAYDFSSLSGREVNGKIVSKV